MNDDEFIHSFIHSPTRPITVYLMYTRLMVYAGDTKMKHYNSHASLMEENKY